MSGDSVVGSSVMLVSAHRTPSSFESAPQISIQFTGEAVSFVSENGDRAYMTLISKSGPSGKEFAGPAIYTLAGSKNRGGHEAFWSAIGTVSGSWSEMTGAIPEREWRMFVAFRNPSDPSSVYEVDPHELGIEEIRVTTTSDPVTSGLRRELPWLSGVGDRLEPIRGLLRGEDMTLAQILKHSDFRLGFDE